MMNGETSKAHRRRLESGWFDKYILPGPGIDIGCGDDPLNDTFDRWDLANGDATHLREPFQNYQTVYASHVLEHLDEPDLALLNWWSMVRPGGHLIVVVPHRDLYENRTRLPSLWNGDHRNFFLPFDEDERDTLSLSKMMCPLYRLSHLDISVHSGPVIDLPPMLRVDGVDANSEYSIEGIARKA